MSISTLAPIILFCYNRLEYLTRTVEALQKNDLASESELIIYCDGIKNPADAEKVNAVREYIRNITGFKQVEIHISDENRGLAKSIISGVTETLKRYDKVIVMEDDLVTTPCFLRFMNDALNLYESVEEVACITGYTPVTSADKDFYFMKGADCLGWATWSRGWQYFNADSYQLFERLKEKKCFREFDLNGAYPYTEMLIAQMNGKVNSWAIRWRASTFLYDKLTLHSGKNLVEHIGYSGTHVRNRDRDINYELSSEEPVVTLIGQPQVDQEMLHLISRFYRKTRWSWKNWIKGCIKAVIPLKILMIYWGRGSNSINNDVR